LSYYTWHRVRYIPKWGIKQLANYQMHWLIL